MKRRKEAQAAHDENSLTEQFGGAVVEVDGQLEITRVLAVEGMPSNPESGMSLSCLIPKESLGRIAFACTAARESRRSQVLEYAAFRGEKKRWFQAQIIHFGEGEKALFLVSITEITQQKELEAYALEKQNALENHYRLQKLIFSISADFLRTPFDRIDEVIDNSLRRMGTFVGADRAYIFTYDFERNIYNNTYEWCAEGITPEIDNLQDGDLAEIPGWVDSHCRGESVYIPDVEHMEEGAVRQTLLPQRVKSLITVPLHADGACSGFVGFDSVLRLRRYSLEEQELLSGYGSLLLHLLRRREVEIELGGIRREQGILLDTIETQVFFLTDEMTYGRVNRAHAEFFGLQVEQMEDRRLDEIFPREMAEVCRLGNSRVFAEGEPLYTREWSPSADGELRLLSISKQPLLDDAGRVQFVVCSAQDITEEMRAQKALAASSRKYNALFEKIPEGVFLHDLDGTILEVNTAGARQLGHEKDELIGTSVFSLHDDSFDREHLLRSWRNWSVGEAVVFETRNIHKDGHGVPVEITAARVSFDGGDYIQALVRDITEKKQTRKERVKLQKQLHQMRKLESLGRLAGGVAHEFNNQLSAILGYAELSLHNLDTPGELEPDIQAIITASNSASALTQQLLAFARRQNNAPELVSVNRELSGMRDMISEMLSPKIHLIWQLGEDLPDIMLDREQLEQIVLSLFANSQEAMSEGGSITVETEQVMLDQEAIPEDVQGDAESYVRISIVDTGIGMDKKTADLAFEPFFTTKEVGEGSGLGLPMVHGIAAQHEGWVRLESVAGEGTRVDIYLPAAD